MHDAIGDSDDDAMLNVFVAKRKMIEGSKQAKGSFMYSQRKNTNKRAFCHFLSVVLCSTSRSIQACFRLDFVSVE